MAAAYASLVSLLNTLHQLQNHPRFSTVLDKKQIQCIRHKVSFLQDFLERYSNGGSQEAQHLERQIAGTAHLAEDRIDAHIALQIHAESTGFLKTPVLTLQEVIDEMDSIKEKVKEIWDMRSAKVQPLTRHSNDPIANSTRAPPIGKTAMVGFEDELTQIMEWLTGGQFSRQVISIVGMGGAGKSTLARSAYESPYIEQYFHIQIWVTISQEYTVRDILLQIPICQRKQSSSNELLTEDKLGEVLYKSLSGQKYLIVMDDMWGIDAWDNIRFFFPDNGNMSRILVTTRLSNVALHFGSNYCLKLNFLDEYKSWELFCETVFKEACPLELEGVGKEIVRKCRGLPLTIIVIGGLLAKSRWTQQYWESVAKDVNSILSTDDEDYCLSVLSLSYAHLSTHLKPCFVYMGIFPEDHEIRASELIRLWIAEELLQPDKNQSLEEVATNHLNDLVDRNLILVRSRGLSGKIKTCYIHDVMRDLCLKIAQNEDFLGVLKGSDSSHIVHGMRRIVSHSISHSPVPSFTRSYTNFRKGHPFSFKNRPQLRVLNNVAIRSQEDISQQVNLRYLCYTSFFRAISLCPSLVSQRELDDWKFLKHNCVISLIPSFVSRLWNLQTLIIHPGAGSSARVLGIHAIWEMQQLRHVQVQNMYLPHPHISGNTVHRNLHTLMELVNFRWSREVLKRIPNIKKIKLSFKNNSFVSFDAKYFGLHNLHLFEMLESLYIDFPANIKADRGIFYLKFIRSLKKLTLGRSVRFFFDDMEIIVSLPCLEVLKFEGLVKGLEWNPIEGELSSLRCLKVESCPDLEYWNVNISNFPVLQSLHLGSAPRLEEIPTDIGEIPTLELINICDCKASAAISALQILNEQENLGNDGLKVRVELVDHRQGEIFEEYMELEGLPSNKFHYKTRRGWYRDLRHLGISWEDWFDSVELEGRLLEALVDQSGQVKQFQYSEIEERKTGAGLKTEHVFRNKVTQKQLMRTSSRLQNRICTEKTMQKKFR